jgi:butyrate response factor 1
MTVAKEVLLEDSAPHYAHGGYPPQRSRQIAQESAPHYTHGGYPPQRSQQTAQGSYLPQRSQQTAQGSYLPQRSQQTAQGSYLPQRSQQTAQGSYLPQRSQQNYLPAYPELNQANMKTFDSSKEKTQLCLFMKKEGDCPHGSDCNFAHCLEELPHNGKLYKTELCNTFMSTGRCKYGIVCNFAHGDEELRYNDECEDESEDESEDEGEDETSDVPDDQDISMDQKMELISDERYKITICKHWENTGRCRRGAMCVFAHGESDMWCMFREACKYNKGIGDRVCTRIHTLAEEDDRKHGE